MNRFFTSIISLSLFIFLVSCDNKPTSTSTPNKAPSTKTDNSVKTENLIVDIFDTPKNVPSPIDAYFAGVYYIGPINIGFRGTPEAVVYYQEL